MALYRSLGMEPPEQLEVENASFEALCEGFGLTGAQSARARKLLLDGFGAAFVANSFRLRHLEQAEKLCEALGVPTESQRPAVVQPRSDNLLDALAPLDPRIATILRESDSVRSAVNSALRHYFLGPDEDLAIVDVPELEMVEKSLASQKARGVPLSRWALALEALQAQQPVDATARLTGLTYAEVAILARRVRAAASVTSSVQ